MPLTIRKLHPSFGAELRGLDLRRLDDVDLAAVYEAFVAHGLLLIPGQALDVDQHLAFSRQFGELWELPEGASRSGTVGRRSIDEVSNVGADGAILDPDSRKMAFAAGNQLWHSDLSFHDVPAKASLLHAREIATEGGETEFADLHAAYDALPAQTRQRLEGLVAEHNLLHSRRQAGFEAITAADREAFPSAFQPLVRVHPETGRKALFVGAHACHIVGMPDADGAALLCELLQHATQPAFTVSHRWAVHDLLVWDNRRTLHRGRPYPATQHRRVMHRATVKGRERTVVDGRIVVGA